MAEAGDSGSQPRVILPSDEDDEPVDQAAPNSHEPPPDHTNQATRSLEALGQDVVKNLNLQKNTTAHRRPRS